MVKTFVKYDSFDFQLKYNVDRLVYYEACANIVVAIEREKQIKTWSRKKKDKLINTLNPEWNDISIVKLEIVPLQGDPSLRSE